jgi:branched-chain amino acid transport system ATP-binding protein
VLLLDEPSMGLSPIMVDKIFEVVADIHGRGTTILLVEQNASRALGLANRGYVMESGEVTMSGDAKALLDDPARRRLRAAYLGELPAGRWAPWPPSPAASAQRSRRPRCC